MKSLLIIFIVVISLTGCTNIQDKTAIEVVTSEHSAAVTSEKDETINNTSDINSEFSASISNKDCILLMLKYLENNYDSVIGNFSDLPYKDVQVIFQDFYDDDKPEMMFKIDVVYEKVIPQVMIFTVENGKVIEDISTDFEHFIEGRYKFQLVEKDGIYYNKFIQNYSQNSIISFNPSNAVTSDLQEVIDYSDEYFNTQSMFISVIDFDGVNSLGYGFSISEEHYTQYKNTYILGATSDILTSNTINSKSYEKYKNLDTGMYEWFEISQELFDIVGGKKLETVLEKKLQTESTMLSVSKEKYFEYTEKFWSMFKEVDNPRYESKWYPYNDIDYSVIAEDAIKMFGKSS